MFDRAYNIANPSDEMLAYLEANRLGYEGLRRRAVIYKSGLNWTLHACVVEGIIRTEQEVPKEQSREYGNAVLYEDWLSANELRTFLVEILHGTIRLGSNSLDTGITNRSWSKERQPLANSYMPYAGYVWTSQFHTNVNSMNDVLLAPGQPYYPDLHEAVQDWMPFTVYPGSSDGRKGEISMLLPESRAYLQDAIAHGDSVALKISGAMSEKLVLEVKGAWWDEKGIHHFSEPVLDGHCKLSVPADITRLEYILVDAEGVAYDYQSENAYRHSGLGRHRDVGGPKSLANDVAKALNSGEGKHTEFKSFIYPHIRKDDDKAMEIIKTVAAFSNTEGGKIFIGITDEGDPIGINEPLHKWATEKQVVDKDPCENYISALRTLVPNQLLSDVKLNYVRADWEGRIIVIIEVAEAQDKPVILKRARKNLYIRRGANSMSATPEEWKHILVPSTGGFNDMFPNR